MILSYDAISRSGQPTTDSIEASTRQEALERLRQKGLYVTRIAESQPKHAGQQRAAPSKGFKMPLNVLVQITRQIAMLLRAGSEVVPALQAIMRQITNVKHKALLRHVIVDLEDGMQLSEALQKHPSVFDPVYCAIVAAGEASGTLSRMFDRLASVVGKRRALRRKITGAMAYPALLIVMCFKITLLILLFVLPRFAIMFERLNAQVPPTTQVLLNIGTFLMAHWLALICGVVGLVVITVVTLRSDAGRQWLSDIQIYIPIIGRLRSRMIQGQVFRTLGTLLESGVGILESVDLAARATTNSRYRRMFSDLVQSVTSGGGIASAIDRSGLVDPAICQAIRTGEETGSLGGAFTFCADTFDESNEELVTTLMRLLEPVILLGMGLVVGTVAVSLFMPLFDMTSAMH